MTVSEWRSGESGMITQTWKCLTFNAINLWRVKSHVDEYCDGLIDGLSPPSSEDHSFLFTMSFKVLNWFDNCTKSPTWIRWITDYKIWIQDMPTVLLRNHQLMICDWKAPKVISLYFRDSSESQKYRTQVPTLLQVKNGTARQQMRVGAREGFAYRSVKLVILANCYR